MVVDVDVEAEIEFISLKEKFIVALIFAPLDLILVSTIKYLLCAEAY